MPKKAIVYPKDNSLLKSSVSWKKTQKTKIVLNNNKLYWTIWTWPEQPIQNTINNSLVKSTVNRILYPDISLHIFKPGASKQALLPLLALDPLFHQEFCKKKLLC